MLNTILREEGDTDKKLTKLAKSVINLRAKKAVKKSAKERGEKSGRVTGAITNMVKKVVGVGAAAGRIAERPDPSSGRRAGNDLIAEDYSRLAQEMRGADPSGSGRARIANGSGTRAEPGVIADDKLPLRRRRWHR